MVLAIEKVRSTREILWPEERKEVKKKSAAKTETSGTMRLSWADLDADSALCIQRPALVHLKDALCQYIGVNPLYEDSVRNLLLFPLLDV
jgi:hypothetical protein